MNGFQESLMCEDVLNVSLIILIERKKCSKCGEIKPISEFNKDKRLKDGLTYSCRACRKQYWEDTKVERHKQAKQYRQKNKAEIADKKKAYRQKHKIQIKKYMKQYYENHLSDEFKAIRAWRIKNPKEWEEKKKQGRRESSRRWSAANPEKVKEKNKNWRINNPQAASAMGRRAVKKQRSTPKGRLGSNISRMIRRSLRGTKNGSSWESLVGYTLTQLKTHLEKLFTHEMTWENYGAYWSIDHIIPQVAFNYGKPTDPDFKKCWALDNLRPLNAITNKRKGSKLHFTLPL